MLKIVVAVVAIVLVALAGYAAWRSAPGGGERLGAVPEGGEAQPTAPEVAPSRQIAEETLDRFETFRSGGPGPRRLALGSTELTSVLRFSMTGLVPEGVSEPAVELSGDEVGVSARVALDAFPDLQGLEGVSGFLPDTVPLEIGGTFVPLERSRVALMVHRMEIAHVPLPEGMFPEVLDGLGRPSPWPDAAVIVVPSPDGVSNASIERDSLVLTSSGPGSE